MNNKNKFNLAKTVKKNNNLYAAIDLGTNACRLTIATESYGRVRVIDTLSRIINFGEGLYSNGVLSEKAMVRALKALKDCSKKIEQYDIADGIYVATEACRKARNVNDFLDMVEDESGLKIRIISSREEAYFSTLACIELMDRSYPYGVVFDIGGGSTEISWFRYISARKNIEIIDATSIPFGFITIADPDDDGVRLMKKMKIREMVEDFYTRNEIYKNIAKNEVQMIGVSGTMNSLVNILLDVDVYNSRVVNGFVMRNNDIEEMLEYIRLTDEINALSGQIISTKQKHRFLSDSCIILGEIHSVFFIPITVADRGLRDGILLHLIRKNKEKDLSIRSVKE